MSYLYLLHIKKLKGACMHSSNPTLWRTCRVVACETRLQLLWHIFQHEKLFVTELARLSGISTPTATIHLRALNARGLIIPHREKMKVFYRAEANSAVAFAPELLAALRNCCENDIPFKTVIRRATAFTHERRIELIRSLTQSEQTFDELLKTTGMSASSLSRHSGKLKARGLIRRNRGKYRLEKPGDELGHVLLEAACS
jgi:DNA-binding transcriptional ArsR family regulator